MTEEPTPGAARGAHGVPNATESLSADDLGERDGRVVLVGKAGIRVDVVQPVLEVVLEERADAQAAVAGREELVLDC